MYLMLCHALASFLGARSIAFRCLNLRKPTVDIGTETDLPGRPDERHLYVSSSLLYEIES